MGMVKICIDAGHGGYDSGSIASNVKEKDLSLNVTKELNDLLVRDGNYQTILTRSDDYAAGHYEHQVSRELSERARISNDFHSDLFVSIHFGASQGDVAIAQRDINNTGIATKVKQSIESSLKLTGVELEETNNYLAVLREVKAPALVIEFPFTSNSGEIVQSLYDAICGAFNLAPTSSVEPTVPISEVNNNTTPDSILASTQPNVDITQEATIQETPTLTSGVTPEVTKKTPARANINGIDIVTHEEASELLNPYAKTEDVNSALKALKEYVDSNSEKYVKVSDLKQHVIAIIAQVLQAKTE